MRPGFRSSATPLALAAVLLVAIAPAAVPSKRRTYDAFAKQNDAAMAKMMADMAVKPTGDVDVDFVGMMIPHHQGAIDMARAVLRYGHNEKLNAIARGIVVQQTREIKMMRDAVGGHVPVAAPTGRQHHMMM